MWAVLLMFAVPNRAKSMNVNTAHAPLNLDDLKTHLSSSSSLKKSAVATNETKLTLGAKSEALTYEKLLKARASANVELQAYRRLREKVSSETFDVRALAKSFMQKAIQNKNKLDIDPDKVYLHYFGQSAVSSPTAFTGWEHDKQPIHSCTLTELALRNFSASMLDKDPDTLNSIYGVYHAGPGAALYGTENEVPMTAYDLKEIMREGDFYGLVTQKFKQFWADHETDVRTLGKAQFIAAANLARNEGSLSEADYAVLMKGGAPNVQENGPVTMAELRTAAAPDPSVRVRHLDINGYASSDILLFKDAGTGREMMYMPGESPAIYAFDNDHEMRTWVAEQSRDTGQRSRLLGHFSLQVRQDGLLYTGVENGLKKLGSGTWPISDAAINRADNSIRGDVFEDVVTKIKERSFQDADTLIHSNSEVNRDRWLGYLRVANQIGSPLLALVGGPVGALVGAAAFGAQLGVEIDQAVQGDSQAERRQGATAVGLDVGMALLFGVLTASPTETELPLVLDNAESNEIPRGDALSQRLYRIKTQGLGGRGAPEIARIWTSEETQSMAQQSGQMAGWEILDNARAAFQFANPKFSLEASTFLNQVMNEGLLIDEAIEKQITKTNVEFKIHSTTNDAIETVSSSDAGFDNFVQYKGNNYLRYLDRLFLVDAQTEPSQHFVVKSIHDNNRPLCTLVPDLQGNKTGNQKKVILKEPTLQGIEKQLGKVRYYGIAALKIGDENLYEYLMASIKNARLLLNKAQVRLSDTSIEQELKEQLQTLGIGNLADKREQILKLMRDCDDYLASLQGRSGDRVVVMERQSLEQPRIAFTEKNESAKRIYLQEKFFHSPTLEAAFTLIHETSHIVGNTIDLWYSTKASNMVMMNDKLLDKFEYATFVDLKSQFQMDIDYSKDIIKNLTSEQAEAITKSGSLLPANFVQYYNENLRLTGKAENATSNVQKALDAFNNDSEFKESAILNNADSFSILVEAMASTGFFKGEFSLEDPTRFVNKQWFDEYSRNIFLDAEASSSHRDINLKANEI